MFISFVCICVCTYACVGAHIEGRKQLSPVKSFLPLCGVSQSIHPRLSDQEANTLVTEPSHWPLVNRIQTSEQVCVLKIHLES